MACCFWLKVLNRLDLPTLGRPIKASFSVAGVLDDQSTFSCETRRRSFPSLRDSRVSSSGRCPADGFSGENCLFPKTPAADSTSKIAAFSSLVP